MTDSSPQGVGRLMDVQRLGVRPYAEVLELQKELLEKRINDEVRDTLILVEHEPVITVGRKGAQLGEVPVPVFEVERGGEATYHGPGQVVAYPIFKLPEERRDVHRYLRDLERVVIGVLGEFELEGTRVPEATGVWLGDKKVASVGVALRRWVTWHGLALNVHTDLGAFRPFQPCGLDPECMTRLADHAELPDGNLLCEVLLVKHFLEVFDLELPYPPDPQGTSSGGFPDLPILN
ncbi:MAG: lipoyl(octanoyl) transferase LipB [Planctomycetota bacterium]|nr:lipoyl(octanoyl) transferase LipB [Planctomycetota bacterium]MDP6938444.1 lipoyl(octanoyl) transferase LipB [Planctomycetota bacterium]